MAVLPIGAHGAGAGSGVVVDSLPGRHSRWMTTPPRPNRGRPSLPIASPGGTGSTASARRPPHGVRSIIQPRTPSDGADGRMGPQIALAGILVGYAHPLVAIDQVVIGDHHADHRAQTSRQDGEPSRRQVLGRSREERRCDQAGRVDSADREHGPEIRDPVGSPGTIRKPRSGDASTRRGDCMEASGERKHGQAGIIGTGPSGTGFCACPACLACGR